MPNRPHDLASFTLGDMISLGAALRRGDPDARSIEQVGRRTVETLRARLLDPRIDGPSCLLARLYRTQPFGSLDNDLKVFARASFPEDRLSDETRCLTLVASAGELPEWNDPALSRGHRTIPLPSVEIVSRLPMVAQLIKQFGLDLAEVVDGNQGLVLDPNGSAFNVFHVEDAAGSPHVPAQDEFVVPFGVRSVLGFGGILPGPDLFAVILFSRTHIPRETADLFKTVALSVKLALLPFSADPAPDPPPTQEIPTA